MVFGARRGDARPDELPDRDGVERDLAAADAAWGARAARDGADLADAADADADEPTAPLSEVRPPLRGLLARWALTVGFPLLVAAASLALLTSEGRQAALERGPLAAAFGWIAFVLVVMVAALAAMAIGRAVNGGLRRLRQRDVIPAALGEAVTAAVGGTAGAFLGAIATGDLLRVLSFSFVLVGLFSAAAIVPAYAKGFREAAR